MAKIVIQLCGKDVKALDVAHLLRAVESASGDHFINSRTGMDSPVLIRDGQIIVQVSSETPED